MVSDRPTQGRVQLLIPSYIFLSFLSWPLSADDVAPTLLQVKTRSEKNQIYSISMFLIVTVISTALSSLLAHTQKTKCILVVYDAYRSKKHPLTSFFVQKQFKFKLGHFKSKIWISWDLAKNCIWILWTPRAEVKRNRDCDVLLFLACLVGKFVSPYRYRRLWLGHPWFFPGS